MNRLRAVAVFQTEHLIHSDIAFGKRCIGGQNICEKYRQHHCAREDEYGSCCRHLLRALFSEDRKYDACGENDCADQEKKPSEPYKSEGKTKCKSGRKSGDRAVDYYLRRELAFCQFACNGINKRSNYSVLFADCGKCTDSTHNRDTAVNRAGGDIEKPIQDKSNPCSDKERRDCGQSAESGFAEYSFE